MTLKEIENYCLLKTGSFLDFPFGMDVAVIKVKSPSQEKGRIFAQLLILQGIPKVTLSCDAIIGEIWRANYPCSVERGYHCPKVQQPYFNTVTLTPNSTPSDDVLMEMIDHAYETTIGKMPKKYRKELEGFVAAL
ncbi:MAG: MmcQ/YjbR family DNA-binding protein [Defluviitaleaceae bacterium]|nr:MmcQ/YjbR family DNA-binding protein [Defluviitaleaceae bacterium]